MLSVSCIHMIIQFRVPLTSCSDQMCFHFWLIGIIVWLVAHNIINYFYTVILLYAGKLNLFMNVAGLTGLETALTAFQTHSELKCHFNLKEKLYSLYNRDQCLCDVIDAVAVDYTHLPQCYALSVSLTKCRSAIKTINHNFHNLISWPTKQFWATTLNSIFLWIVVCNLTSSYYFY